MEDHDHEAEVTLVDTEHVHEAGFSFEELTEVMFGAEHVASEIFWNLVFIGLTFLFTKAVALRKIHKYVDDKHGISHDKY